MCQFGSNKWGCFGVMVLYIVRIVSQSVPISPLGYKICLIPRNILKDNERQRRVYDIRGKSPTLLARSDTPKILINNKIRKLTPLECERLQGLPDNYTAKFSNTTRYKMIGNGFTVQVIKYILSFVSKKTTKKKQLELFH